MNSKDTAPKRFFGKFLLPYKLSVIWALVLGALYGVTNTLSYWLMASIFNILFKTTTEKTAVLGSEDSINGYIKEFIVSVIGDSDLLSTLKILAVMVLGIFVVKNFFRFTSSWQLRKVILQLTRDVKSVIIKHIVSQSHGFIDKVETGKLFSYYNNDLNTIKSGLKVVSLDFVINVFTIVSILFMLFSISTPLFVMTLVILPASGIVISLISKSLRRKSKRRLKQSAQLNNSFNEIVTGFGVIKSFNQEDKVVASNRVDLDKLYKLQKKESRMSLMTSPINEVFVSMIGMAIFVYAGKEFYLSGQLSSEDFIRFFTLLFGIFHPIKMLGKLHNRYNILVAAIERMMAFFDTNVKVDESESTQTCTHNSAIELKDVSFGYNPAHLVLEKVNLAINRGEKIAFVGPSGGGKSTVSKLIERFYDVTSGEVLFDGINVKNLDLESVRNNIAYIDQNVFLFNETIKDNILFGNKDTEPRDYEQIIIDSGCEFINDLPDGDSTDVGEKGNLLSGGQKQRITIARAMIKDAPIMVFDEATSALDNKTEKLIQDVIFNKLKDKTVMIIAHRLSTIQNCDKIVLLKSGQIEAVGSHEELLKTNRLYKELYTSNN